MNRRRFLALLAAPAIIRVADLMPVRALAPRLIVERQPLIFIPELLPIRPVAFTYEDVSVCLRQYGMIVECSNIAPPWLFDRAIEAEPRALEA